MANLIKAITTGVGGISTTADASGAITFQKDSTTTATIDASGNFAAAGNISTPTGTVTASSFVGNGSGLTGLGQIQTQIFTAPGTWTKPASCTQVKVTVVGGGGGGFFPAPANNGGGTGGIAIATVPVSAPVSITVGTQGTGTPGNGTSGNTSSFGAFVSCTGGAGATGPTQATPGTATVSTGTIIRTSSTSPNSNAETILNATVFTGSGAPVTPAAGALYSTTTAFKAGIGGPSNIAPATTGAGGVGGAVLVEFIG